MSEPQIEEGRVNEPDRLISPNEAAKILSVSRQTVMRYIANGSLPAIKLGPSKISPVRIRRSALMDFIDGSRQAEVHYT